MLGSPSRSATRCNLMTSRLRFFLPLFAVFALAACGGSSREQHRQRASASTDANALLRATFSNLDKMKSARST